MVRYAKQIDAEKAIIAIDRSFFFSSWCRGTFRIFEIFLKNFVSKIFCQFCGRLYEKILNDKKAVKSHSLKGPLKNPKNISDIPHQKIHRKDLFVKVWFSHFHALEGRKKNRHTHKKNVSHSETLDSNTVTPISQNNVQTIKGKWSQFTT